MNFKNYSALLVLLLLPILGVRAQVTIGADDPPQDFSILEVVSNEKGGFRLPHLTTAQRNTLQASSDFQTEVINKDKGLTIYNTDIDCVEYWNGKKWISHSKGSSLEPCLEPCDCDGDGFLATACGGSDSNDDDPCNSAVTPLVFTSTPTGSVVVGTPVTITVTTTGANPVNNVSLDGGETRIKGDMITVTPGKVGTNTYTITINNCPSQIVTVGACVPYMFTYQTMALTANKSEGSDATGYQWYLDGTAIVGATSSNPSSVANQANTWAWLTGYKLSDALYLPVAGYRNPTTGEIVFASTSGFYWSSTVNNNYSSYGLLFSNSDVNPSYRSNRAPAGSVRS